MCIAASIVGVIRPGRAMSREDGKAERHCSDEDDLFPGHCFPLPMRTDGGPGAGRTLRGG
jgi:hypothetical protein